MKPKTKLVIKLRETGMTYSQISQETNLSKGNISYICNKYIPNDAQIYTSNILLKQTILLSVSSQLRNSL